MKIFKQIKPHRLIFLIVLLAGNTFAWFIYTSKVDGAVQVHVKAWNVVFQAGDNEVSSNITINVSNIYPGMEDYEYNVTAYNRSEVSANLSYKVLEARILDTEYITEEGRIERQENPVPTDLTSAQLIQKLANDYPFAITFSVSNSNIAVTNGEEEYTLSVTWPYEQSNDSLDTSWGIAAANFKEEYSNMLSSIELKIKLIITQNPS